MGYTTDIYTIQQQVASRLVEITANPKPSYNVNGQQVSWNEYARMLREQLESINRVVADHEAVVGLYEITSQGFTG